MKKLIIVFMILTSFNSFAVESEEDMMDYIRLFQSVFDMKSDYINSTCGAGGSKYWECVNSILKEYEVNYETYIKYNKEIYSGKDFEKFIDEKIAKLKGIRIRKEGDCDYYKLKNSIQAIYLYNTLVYSLSELIHHECGSSLGRKINSECAKKIINRSEDVTGNYQKGMAYLEKHSDKVKTMPSHDRRQYGDYIYIADKYKCPE